MILLLIRISNEVIWAAIHNRYEFIAIEATYLPCKEQHMDLWLIIWKVFRRTVFEYHS